MKNFQRQRYLDVAKGIGIILVVIGHCIPDASTLEGISNKNFAVLFSVIYSFHMPLFFFISGYLSKILYTTADRISSLKKKFERLMIPYFFVGICYLPMKLTFSKFANRPFDLSDLPKIFLGVNPDGELWFLYVLFVTSATLIFFGNRINTAGLILLFVSAIWDIRANLLPVHIFWFLFFFALGAYVKQNCSDLFKNFSLKIFAVSLGSFVLGNYMLLTSSFEEWRLLTSLTGIAGCLYISKAITIADSMITKLFEMLGLLSMELYILSDIIKIPFRIVFWNGLHLYFVSFLVCTVCAILGSIFLSKYVIHRNKFLSFAVLGMRK